MCISYFVCIIDQVGSIIYTGDCMTDSFFSVYSLAKFYKLFRLFFFPNASSCLGVFGCF